MEELLSERSRGDLQPALMSFAVP
uniref:Uncharacterized protein n=1 Tax=Anguilla anguilla TaxID=7936 RepID=A0A0E9TK43_ANGAN